MSVPDPGRRGLVLVAWDGSETGRRALLHAARVVGRGGRVAVVNVLPHSRSAHGFRRCPTRPGQSSGPSWSKPRSSLLIPGCTQSSSQPPGIHSPRSRRPQSDSMPRQWSSGARAAADSTGESQIASFDEAGPMFSSFAEGRSNFGEHRAAAGVRRAGL